MVGLTANFELKTLSPAPDKASSHEIDLVANNGMALATINNKPLVDTIAITSTPRKPPGIH